MNLPLLETERLIVRPWREDDFSAFADINTDPRVQAFFHIRATRDSSIAMAGRIKDRIERYGYGLLAVEHKRTHAFIGFTGVSQVHFPAHFTPCMEIAWRIAPSEWGKGYATEAARAVLRDGFARLALLEIVAFTLPDNHASRRVMEKIGMTYDPRDDFDHPDIPKDDPKARMVLYRASA